MKNMKLIKGALLAGVCVCGMFVAEGRELVILQTNDTHSQIDPTDKGYGGVQRRKVFVDSVRAARPDVLLVDAGDAVQGTLFFTLYGGEVEMKAMNNLGYDIAILGNHDFDNGMEAMARNVAMSDADWLATNYEFSDSAVGKLFKPFRIYDYDGHKVGFIALNLDPEGMIAAGNADGVKYLDAVEAANAAAWWLKHQEGADMVVAVSHLGYENVPSPSDQDIISNTKDIDIVLVVEFVGGGEEGFTDELGATPFILVVGDCLAAEVETESEVTGDVEFLGDTAADADHTVVLVFPFNIAVAFEEFGECPVETTTGIEVCVVNAAGTVATPPVGEVDHYVKGGTSIVDFGLVVLAVLDGFPGNCTEQCSVNIGKTLY